MGSQTFAERVIRFNKELVFDGDLPPGFSVMNPFLDNPNALVAMESFYRKFYSDNKPRRFIIGINPSRHGAGVTGIPFTDTKRLADICGILLPEVKTHELSSVFMYDLIAAFGGPTEFYGCFYINSPFPLAIVRNLENGKQVNANYYDDPKLFQAVKPFMQAMLRKQVEMGIITDDVLIMGKKNAEFIRKLNAESKLFKSIRTVEHPRYIQQYKSRDKTIYIGKYLTELNAMIDVV